MLFEHFNTNVSMFLLAMLNMSVTDNLRVNSKSAHVCVYMTGVFFA